MDGVDLRIVARRQRWLVWLFFGAVLSFLVAFLPLHRFGAAAVRAAELTRLVIHFLLLIGVVLTLHATRAQVITTVICGLLMLAPCVNLLILTYASLRATNLLEDAGLRVGLLGGVRDKDVMHAMNPHLCRSCGYNLTGNVSGRCPECGSEIRRANVVRIAPADRHSA